MIKFLLIIQYANSNIYAGHLTVKFEQKKNIYFGAIRSLLYSPNTVVRNNITEVQFFL